MTDDPEEVETAPPDVAKGPFWTWGLTAGMFVALMSALFGSVPAHYAGRGALAGGLVGAALTFLVTRWMWRLANRPLRLRRENGWVVGRGLKRPLPAGKGVIRVTEWERKDPIDGSFDAWVHAIAYLPPHPRERVIYLFACCREPRRVYRAAKALCRIGHWGLMWPSTDETVAVLRPWETVDEPLTDFTRRTGPPKLHRPGRPQWELDREGHNGVCFRKKHALGRWEEIAATREGVVWRTGRRRMHGRWTPAEAIEDIFHERHEGSQWCCLRLVGERLFRQIGQFESYEEADYVRSALIYALQGELPRELFEPEAYGRLECEPARM